MEANAKEDMTSFVLKFTHIYNVLFFICRSSTVVAMQGNLSLA
jgi:hypothetical protein